MLSASSVRLLNLVDVVMSSLFSFVVDFVNKNGHSVTKAQVKIARGTKGKNAKRTLKGSQVPATLPSEKQAHYKLLILTQDRPNIDA